MIEKVLDKQMKLNGERVQTTFDVHRSQDVRFLYHWVKCCNK